MQKIFKRGAPAPLDLPLPAYYSSYFISNCPTASRAATTNQQSKFSLTVYNISPIHINSPWPFVNNSNPMLCSVVSSPRPQPTTSQHQVQQNVISDGFRHPQQPLLSCTLSRNPATTSRASQISPIGSSVRKKSFHFYQYGYQTSTTYCTQGYTGDYYEVQQERGS